MTPTRPLLVAAAAAALCLTSCAQTPPAGYPSDTPGATASAPTPQASAAPTAPGPATATGSPGTGSPSTSGAPTASGLSVPSSGSLSLFFEASRKLTGSCSTADGVPTLTGADRRNDFFGTIDASLVLAPDRARVEKLTIELGEDSERISRTLTYTAARPATGTSAALRVQGNTFRVIGKLAVSENGPGASQTTPTVMPVTLKVTCASGYW